MLTIYLHCLHLLPQKLATLTTLLFLQRRIIVPYLHKGTSIIEISGGISMYSTASRTDVISNVHAAVGAYIGLRDHVRTETFRRGTCSHGYILVRYICTKRVPYI